MTSRYAISAHPKEIPLRDGSAVGLCPLDRLEEGPNGSPLQPRRMRTFGAMNELPESRGSTGACQ